GVGGKPVRSREARRISVRRSAGGEGFSPLASSFASTKASIGVFTHARSFTIGTAGFRTGWKAQCRRWVLGVRVLGPSAFGVRRSDSSFILPPSSFEKG